MLWENLLQVRRVPECPVLELNTSSQGVRLDTKNLEGKRCLLRRKIRRLRMVVFTYPNSVMLALNSSFFGAFHVEIQLIAD